MLLLNLIWRVPKRDEGREVAKKDSKTLKEGVDLGHHLEVSKVDLWTSVGIVEVVEGRIVQEVLVKEGAVEEAQEARVLGRMVKGIPMKVVRKEITEEGEAREGEMSKVSKESS